MIRDRYSVWWCCGHQRKERTCSMDIHDVKISKKDIDRATAMATPAQAASFTGDACEIYRTAKPLLQVAVSILKVLYPPASSAIVAVIAIMDKVCEA